MKSLNSFIEFKNVTKKFNQNIALNDVSVTIYESGLHSIIGENGAGKSTLMKLLAGLEKVSAGEMYLRGSRYIPHSAQDAFKNRIGIVHQHFQLAEELTGWDHLRLVAETSRQAVTVNYKEAVKSVLNDFKWDLPLQKKISELSVGEQQRLEILRVLILQPEIIIFDEPTAVLSPQEIEEFLDFLLKLKSQNKTLILISHKLKEIKKVSDYVTILCRGQLVGTYPQADLSVEKMAELMIGRPYKPVMKPLMNHKQFLNKNYFQCLNVDFVEGEIIGVAGVDGNGQVELIEQFRHEVLNKYQKTLADISEDRYKYSLFPKMNLLDHFLLRYRQRFFKWGLPDTSSALTEVQDIIQNWDVRPTNPKMALGDFSGGNQQKYVIGRELWANPDYVLAAHPCRGVDIGAQEKIHSELLNLKNKNKSILLVSSDLDEILNLSDRYIILFKGKQFGPFTASELSTQQVSEYMNGVRS